MKQSSNRTIRGLFNGNVRPWVYCNNKVIGERFLQDAENEGFVFGDGVKPTQKEWHYVIAVHEDGTLAYQGITMWVRGFNIKCLAVDNGIKDILRVDYEKYIAGEEDFICKSPHFSGCIKAEN